MAWGRCHLVVSGFFNLPKLILDMTSLIIVRLIPLFGTMELVEKLIDAVHERGMKIVMDGVFNHTSDQHPWFLSAQDPNAERAEWYIWNDKPNNWTSAFGGSAWTYSAHRDAYYLHTFASSTRPQLVKS